MKKLIVAVCAVMLVVLILFGGQTDKRPAPDILSVSEAAFSIRNSASEDATWAIVGRFEAEDGSRLSFDGCGTVNDIAVNLTTKTGRYTALQTENAMVLRMEFDGAEKLYSVKLASPNGGYILTDVDGNSVTYYPIL